MKAAARRMLGSVAFARWLWIAYGLATMAQAWASPRAHTVYPIFARASHQWWAEQPLYGGAFLYSPTFAVAFTPIAQLRGGGVLWAGLSVALVFYAMRRFVGVVLDGETRARWEGPILALALAGTYHGTWNGQSNALVLALVLLGAEATLRARYTTAAVLLAGAVHVKVWPIVALVVLCMRWPRRLALRCVGALGALAVIPFLTRPWSYVIDQYASWIDFLANRQATVRHAAYRDAWRIWELVVPDNRLFGIVQVVALGALLAACAAMIRRTNERAWVVFAVASWTSWQLLFGPGVEEATYGIIAPMTAWAVIASTRTSDRIHALVAWIMISFLGIWEIETSLARLVPFARAVLPLGVIVYVVWLIRHRDELAGSATHLNP